MKENLHLPYLTMLGLKSTYISHTKPRHFVWKKCFLILFQNVRRKVKVSKAYALLLLFQGASEARFSCINFCSNCNSVQQKILLFIELRVASIKLNVSFFKLINSSYFQLSYSYMICTYSFLPLVYTKVVKLTIKCMQLVTS